MLWCFISAFLSRPQLGNSAKGVGRFRSRLATLRCSRAAAKCGRRSVSHQVLVSDKSHAGSKHCLLSFTANCQQGQDDNLDRGCMLTGFAGKKTSLAAAARLWPMIWLFIFAASQVDRAVNDWWSLRLFYIKQYPDDCFCETFKRTAIIASTSLQKTNAARPSTLQQCKHEVRTALQCTPTTFCPDLTHSTLEGRAPATHEWDRARNFHGSLRAATVDRLSDDQESDCAVRFGYVWLIKIKSDRIARRKQNARATRAGHVQSDYVTTKIVTSHPGEPARVAWITSG